MSFFPMDLEIIQDDLTRWFLKAGYILVCLFITACLLGTILYPLVTLF